jgi:hypothetical protein
MADMFLGGLAKHHPEKAAAIEAERARARGADYEAASTPGGKTKRTR